MYVLYFTYKLLIALSYSESGLIIKRGIRVKLTIKVRLKLGQTFASGLTLINKR